MQTPETLEKIKKVIRLREAKLAKLKLLVQYTESGSIQTVNTLATLEQTLYARKTSRAETSYVAGLYAKGTEAIAKKIIEEALEVAMAAKDLDGLAEGNAAKQTASLEAFTHEVADLWFHSLVMLAHHGGSMDDVLAVLDARHGTSGLAEKAARTNQ